MCGLTVGEVVAVELEVGLGVAGGPGDVDGVAVVEVLTACRGGEDEVVCEGGGGEGGEEPEAAEGDGGLHLVGWLVGGIVDCCGGGGGYK